MPPKTNLDPKRYQSGEHYNGSKWVSLPDGVFFDTVERAYVDEDGKAHSFNPEREEATATAKKAK